MEQMPRRSDATEPMADICFDLPQRHHYQPILRTPPPMLIQSYGWLLRACRVQCAAPRIALLRDVAMLIAGSGPC